MSLEIEVTVPEPPAITVTVEPGGAQGPAGPTAVSADADNIAVLGTDDLIYVPASSGGGGEWGEITGTLTDQTDLQAALADKATAAQGALADTAVQPGDLGTAASSDATDFATAAQGALADAAVQPGDLGTAAALDAPAAGNAALGEVVKGSDTRLSDARTPTAHNHTATDVTDFNTAADARVAAGITGKLDTSAAPELIRDTIGTALVAGTNITITVNDAGDTITIDATGGGGSAQEVRHDSDETYSYMGVAATGTAEGSSGWAVTRITLTSPPVIETGTGTWTGRASISYS